VLDKEDVIRGSGPGGLPTLQESYRTMVTLNINLAKLNDTMPELITTMKSLMNVSVDVLSQMKRSDNRLSELISKQDELTKSLEGVMNTLGKFGME